MAAITPITIDCQKDARACAFFRRTMGVKSRAISIRSSYTVER